MEIKPNYRKTSALICQRRNICCFRSIQSINSKNRPLQSVYAVMFLDATHFKVKQDRAIVNKAAYMVIGIDSVDNLTGFSEAITACFPKTVIQKCIIHQIRNSIKYVSYKDIKKITASLKPIYKAATEEAALLELEQFEQVWGARYPLMVRSWRNNWDEIATFFKYPPEIRKLIYTTNIIESYHRQLRKVTKGKAIFPTDEALLKTLYLATTDVVRKWTGRIQNWGQILLQLSVFFPERIEHHLK